MRRLAGLVLDRRVLVVIGVLAVSLVIWWVGPTIAIAGLYPLESAWARWLVIAGVVLAVVARVALRMLKARRAGAELASGLVPPSSPTATAAPAASAAEVEQLRQRFDDALTLLRTLRSGTDTPSLWGRLRALGSRQYLYELPWYVFIGAPGSGKTTALVNSGLRFPLADRLGHDALRGVGGTRHCDWWFTDEAIFLDTAGRYTTQQSNRDVDATAWKGFLGLLKKTRPRRPVNGVIVTISVADLLEAGPGERESHAQAIRARVRELYQDLGVPLPVYLLVTKTDLLAGFTEFFATLGREERGQAWGLALPFGGHAVEAVALSAELRRLERRLYERLPDRLEEERDAARSVLLYGFPQQFAVLAERLSRFVDDTFAPTKFDATPVLRGVYFTSGTQEGSPIDRVLGAVARDLGLERQLLPPQRASGRSYFLTRLLREVVFPEAGLASVDLRWERRRQRLQTGAITLAAVAVVVATGLWWTSYAYNREYLGEVAAQLEQVKDHVAAVRAGAKSDVSGLLTTLSSVRTLSETHATPNASVPWSLRLGLYQGGKLQAASRAAYQRMLQDTFLPSLTAYVERYLRQDSPASQDEAYDALRTYLMLFEPKRFRSDTVWRWLDIRGEHLLPGAGPEGHRILKAHFDALYSRGWVSPAEPRDDALVAQMRAVVSRQPLANRVYERLKREPMPNVGDFTIAEKAGPAALLVFERASGEPLTRGVPGLYTKDGYYRHLNTRIDLAALQLAEEESWVLGTGGRPLSGAVSSPKVAAAVRRLYLEDYRRIWRRFIGDITVVRDRDLPKTIELTRVLSAPDTPLRTLMKAIERETSLSVAPEAEPGLTGAVVGRTQEYASRARRALGGDADASMEKALVDDHFDDVRRFASGPGGNAPAPLEATVQLLGEFYHLLVASRVAVGSGQTLPPAEAANKLRAEAVRQPEPVRSILQGLVEGGTKQLVENTLRQSREQADAELRAQISDFCLRALGGRYPFVRTSTEDVTHEDFGRLFGPGGLLDGFFQKHLAPYVDTSQKPWRYKDSAMGQSAALAEFQRAQIIRDVFFRSGGTAPNLQLEFKPVEMDATIQQFVLDVDGKLVRYAHGPQVPVRVQFPGPAGRSQVRVSLSPPPSARSTGVTFDGPWALFRMFDAVQIEETRQPERFLATINVEGRRVTFEVSASSVRNPFRLPELTQFRCPTAL